MEKFHYAQDVILHKSFSEEQQTFFFKGYTDGRTAPNNLVLAFDPGGPVWPPRSNAKDDLTAPKIKIFYRGGPVWPPRSNAADDRSGARV